jgi:antitoxin ParD1/3/4
VDKITISVPEAMSRYVKSRIAEGQYGNVSEFFRDLVRRDQERQSHALQELRAMIDKAEAGGASEKDFAQAVAEARREAGQS